MKFFLKYLYRSKMVGEINFQSELLHGEDAIKLAEELENRLQIKVHFVDINDSEWLKKDVKKLVEKEITEPTNIMIYFDGGYDLQSKVAGLGICIYYSQNGKRIRMRKNKMLTGLDNNNEAEYAALEYAINELNWLEVKQQEIAIRGDSKVVLQQLLGEWSVYEETFQNYINRIEKKLLNHQISPVFEILLRNENKEAHNLATQALEGIEIDSSLEIDGGKY